ncbi:YceI family protein [Mucilaginibacter terrenus]|uniref:YceI family protein n=1 Tax=Mucilaginibacter terrenus TaxID=2482727 RepID=A0A3E2NW66_9SPHI|nr:YceI family protein [Mucilaginibacter terrenus]RFZ85255.1 YceI family protein [Mucilaginibacter terrenus]
MKKITLVIMASVMIIASAFKTVKFETYKIDTQKSVIEWNGKKIGGQHNGELRLSSGSITTSNNVPSKGIFVIDMTTITNKDLTDAEYNAKLLGHLKSDDFFGVSKFPTAQFVITRINDAKNGNINISGNLTIKGITKPITFMSAYTINGNTLTAKAVNVKVDRTKYDIRYGSKSFFDSIGDKAIDDDFILNINIVATK